MATYLPSVTDNIKPLELYTPDYSFLSQTLGVTQQRYDRGFSMVRNMYNSLLSSPVTNSQNQQYRDTVFKKLESGIKEVSSVDLANPNNVMKATSLFDPLTNDKELLYDMGMTKHLQQQLALAQSYSNHPDAEKRAQYSDVAKAYVQYGMLELSEAKRGDGSILSVQPRDYVPFEDINAYLSKQAKEQGLEIKSTTSQGYYLVDATNGQQAIQPFAEWAKHTMGTRFDRQLRVQASVQRESTMRDFMTRNTVDKTTALRMATAEIKPLLIETLSEQGVEGRRTLSSIETQIRNFKKAYPNGVPKSKLEEFTNLLKQQESYSGYVQNIEANTRDIIEREEDFLVSNLENFLFDSLKSQTALGWGYTRAMATSKIEVRPDQVKLTMMQEQNEMIRHRENLQLNMVKAERDYALEIEKLNLTARQVGIQERESDYKLQHGFFDREGTAGGTGSGGKKGAAPVVEYMGAYTPTGQTELDAPFKRFNSEKNAALDKMFLATFAKNGMLEGLLEPDDFIKYSSAFKMLSDIATGKIDAKQTTSKQLQSLVHGFKEVNAMAKSLGLEQYDVQISTLTNAGIQNYMLRLSNAIYNKFTESVENDRSGKNLINHEGAEVSPTAYIAGVDAILEAARSYNTVDDKLIAMVSEGTSGGEVVIKSRYKDYFDKVWDPVQQKSVYEVNPVAIMGDTDVAEELRELMSNVVPEQVKQRAVTTGASYNVNNLSDVVISSIFQPGAGVEIKLNGQVTSEIPNFSKLSPANLNELFGKSAQVIITDKESVTFKLTPDINSALFKDLFRDGSKTNTYNTNLPEQSIEVTVPKDLAARLVPNLAEPIKAMTTLKAQPLSIFGDLYRDPDAIVKANSHWKAQGFDFSANYMTNSQGQYGVNINFKYTFPPAPGIPAKVETASRFFPVALSDNAALGNIENAIYNMHSQFITEGKGLQKLYDNEPK